MSANINIVNGRAAFFGLRKGGWHDLGQVVERPVGSEEAIKLAGLDWTVEEHPLVRGDATPVTSHKVIVRGDTKVNLGVVGADWTPIQNEALFHWLDGLDGFADVEIDTAGALGDGETVWVLAKCKGLNFGIKGDEHQGYICLSNGHGGNAQLTITPTMVRVVCQNTLRMMHGGAKRQNTLASGWALKHTSGIEDQFKRIQDCYARTTEAWKRTQEVMDLLATKPITDEAINRLAIEPFAPKPASKTSLDGILDVEAEQGFAKGDERERANTVAAEARIGTIRKIMESPTCKTGAADTLYAAFNAVTEYIEHEAPVKANTKGLDETAKARQIAMRRFEAANFGGIGDDRKAKAFALTLELAGIEA